MGAKKLSYEKTGHPNPSLTCRTLQAKAVEGPRRSLIFSLLAVYGRSSVASIVQKQVLKTRNWWNGIYFTAGEKYMKTTVTFKEPPSRK